MQYYEPNFVGEALVLLDRFGDGAKLLAGGSRVAFEVRSRSHEIGALINLKRIKELSRIEQADDTIFIGALATASALASNEMVARHAPLLAGAARSMGAAQLRSVATLGGNLCSGDPASDLSAALIACGAQCEVLRPESPARTLAVETLLLNGDPVLRPGELLEGVRLPAQSPCWSYQKMMTRRGFEMSLVSIAFCSRIEGNAFRDPRLAVAGAATTCIRARNAEQVLANHPIASDVIARAAKTASEQDANPADDARASAQYRKHLVATLTQRAIAEAIERSQA
jgi:CO/xanthine dehydrogenase FAD-binding subunit